MIKSHAKKMLIIAPYQFGELSDCYYWAKYATLAGWSVTYIGYKYKQRHIKERSLVGVKVKSVTHYSNRRLLGLIFYLKCILEILFHGHKNVIICRMPMCDMLPKIFRRKNIILDVRTLSVSKDEDIRKKQDSALCEIKKSFDKCTAISDGVGQKIGTPYALLPLGAESISRVTKSFEKINLFYIGTFDNRCLSTFIEGLANFQKETGVECSFDIVGGGTEKEELKLKESIIYSGVKGVTLHGFLTHEEAAFLFDKCNIGVCYVPVLDYYQHQPPTKLYEYLLSGMACIATNTISNVGVVTDENGVIVHDNIDSVCQGLIKLNKRMIQYHSDDIIRNAKKYHWEHVVNHYLIKQLVR